jgi:hypothetical protein
MAIIRSAEAEKTKPIWGVDGMSGLGYPAGLSELGQNLV